MFGNIITKIKNFIQPKFEVIEIKFFSPEGRNTIPNGHPIQKSGFIRECNLNREKFTINNNQYLINDELNIREGIHPNQHSLTDYRGGIIIFSTDINSIEINKNNLYNWFKKIGITLINRFLSKSKINSVIKKFNTTLDKKIGDEIVEDYIGAFSIGNFFNGRYIGDNQKVFDEKSLSLEVNGISTNGIIYLAEEIAEEFKQETVLVKDLNTNKIFLVNQIRGGDYNLDKINQKSS